MRKKIVISSFLGNALEFFDFTLCGVFMLVLSKEFFPSSDPSLAVFAGIFAFSAAFYTRPIGALLFGFLGDKYGRKQILSITVFLMGIPTCIIGLLPSYEQIGIAAPLILIGCRLLQGLCTGGEYNGAAIFALEHVQKDRPGLVSGLIASSCVVGALSATVLGGFFLREGAPAWFWRIPFVFGAVISVIGYFLRRYTNETMEFLNAKKQQNTREQNDFSYAQYVKPFLVSVCVGAFNGSLSYTLFGFLNVYLATFVKFNHLSGIWCNIFGLVAFGFSCIFFGSLADRCGIRRSVRIAAVLAIVLSFPAFFLMIQSTLISVILGQILIGIFVGSFVGVTHLFLQTLFPVKIRYQATAFGFCLGMALTGGTTAMLLVYLIMVTENLYVPAMLITAYALTFMASLKLLPKSQQSEVETYLKAA